MIAIFLAIFTRRRTILIITTTTVVLLLTISTASATLITIDTNDNTILDWGSQPLFISDPSNDLDPTCEWGDARDDIIETYVASGLVGLTGKPTYIYFLVKFAEPDPMMVSPHWHKISAYLDCLPVGEDPQDSNVIYSGYYDQVILGDGTLPNPNMGQNYDLNGPEGQRVENDTSNYTFEWSGSLNDMYIIRSNCTPDSIARIKFTTVSVDLNGFYMCTYDDTGW
jgi:hypothetical protein